MKWDQYIPSTTANNPLTPTWVKFYGIPQKYWTAIGLSHIASTVGIPLYADQATEARSKLRYARICINVDLSKPLLTSTQLKMDGFIFDIGIEYQWLPKICNLCKKLNHTEPSCPLYHINHEAQMRTSNVPPNGTTSPIIEGNPSAHNPPNTEWITIQKKKGKKLYPKATGIQQSSCPIISNPFSLLNYSHQSQHLPHLQPHPQQTPHNQPTHHPHHLIPRPQTSKLMYYLPYASGNLHSMTPLPPLSHLRYVPLYLH
ncbi:uncharacterized protein LOC132316704 [Cornus florida]|uniref:uncharacterized protein LOC132316704 n=1 Tax=Cornus florida TaxID=4283 RepID=UPI002896BB19|nr:uncharacterized protein LOC132316704 [Cornus florida]